MPSLDFETEKEAFRTYYNDNSVRFDQAKDAFLTLLRSLLAHAGFGAAAAVGRIKDREESIKKFTRKYQSGLEESKTPYTIQDHITDLIGLRLVCLYEDEIDPIGSLIRKHFEVIDITDKTAEIEGTENAFGYKGLHLDLKLDGARADMPEYTLFAPYRFELQIRTIIQDSWSTLDHKIKYKKSIPPALKRRINTLAALFELADREFRQVRDSTLVEIAKAEAETDSDSSDTDQADEQARKRPVDEAEIERGQFAPLNAFRLLRIAHHFFPDVEFEPNKIDGFTAEVTRREPEISRGKFNYYLRTTIGLVRRYKAAEFVDEAKGGKFNAFTEMRHALYAANPAAFTSMLTNVARESFDLWRTKNAAQIAAEENDPMAPPRKPLRRRNRA
ncbi:MULTISPECIES: (p)ppGpp synthetase [unclassified Mesorhizobium]|uniref:GTP pyrophosphokinase n=1 Tax=unclassified Mesorhizobium TaxID=325217 RepID=UPI0008012B26|nr:MULTISPECIES: (p)ppGpp synthetase [unclassified Mesorhizobium]MDG4886864.1 (p)ppGpp synthetase [Mesorhizobium sp. WSM4887]OBQ92493.1 (p)ppGpp synthetase [Mesorhizobium sp. AA23]